MTLLSDDRKTIVGLEMEKSRETLSDAEILLERERWSGAAGRLYYAVFHAANALLIHDGVTVKSHKGSLIMFNKHYVLTGKMNKEYGVLYSQLETLREESDYSCIFRVDPEILNAKFPLAKEMIDTIAAMVKE